LSRYIRSMKILFPILLVLMLFSCRNHDKKESSSKVSNDTQTVVLDPPVAQRKLSKYETAILQQLDMIDSLCSFSFTKDMNMDSNTKYLDTCNQGIFKTLTKL